MKNSRIEFDINCRAEFKNDKYRMEMFECFVKKILPDYEYMIHLPVDVTGDAKYKLTVAYLREDGKELAMEYAESGKTFITVPKTDSVRIEIVAYSRSGGSVIAGRGYIEEIKPYEKREVTIAAVAAAYREKRTREWNLKEACELIDRVSVHKPDLIALSEAFLGRQVPGSVYDRAVTLDSEEVKTLLAKAKEHNTYICFSIHAFNENGNVQNMAVLAGRNGEIAGVYAKTHLTIGEYECGMEPGEIPGIFETDFGKIGVTICWDLFFPEFVRLYHLSDVDIIVNPTAGFDAARTVERAKESGTYIVVSGTKRHEHSRIVDPEGRVLDRGDAERKYVVTTVDLNKRNYVWYLSCSSYATRKNIFKNERVPELYK